MQKRTTVKRKPWSLASVLLVVLSILVFSTVAYILYGVSVSEKVLPSKKPAVLIPEAFITEGNRFDNVDSLITWHGPDRTNFIKNINSW